MVGSIEEAIEKAEKLEKTTKQMSQEFKIEIISPDKSIYSGKIEERFYRASRGRLPFLKIYPFMLFKTGFNNCWK